jgi:hypothetical protein
VEAAARGGGRGGRSGDGCRRAAAARGRLQQRRTFSWSISGFFSSFFASAAGVIAALPSTSIFSALGAAPASSGPAIVAETRDQNDLRGRQVPLATRKKAAKRGLLRCAGGPDAISFR